MTNHRDRQIQEALRRLASTQPPPTAHEINQVLERATGRQRSQARRAALLVLVAACVLSTIVATVPPGRGAASDLIKGLSELFAGGDAPGSRVPANERPGELNWLQDASADSPRILAQQGNLRLVAYRQQGTNQVCFTVGTAYIECWPGPHWRRVRFRGRPVLGLIVTSTVDPNIRAFWGVTDDRRITTIRLSYADRPSLSAQVQNNGFVMLVPTGTTPSAFEGLDAAGNPVGAGALSDPSLQWQTPCTRPEGC